ncbi:MAG: SIS domain-containing protein [Oligoflexia bacterium]|nr:SIS domain-containing protein [Oligoflexia bacterium]
MSKLETIRTFFNQSLKSIEQTALDPEISAQLLQASELIKAAYLSGGCLFAAGNGGSAADVQHLVAELVARLCRERDSIRAFSMTVDPSIMTAIGNDYGYDEVFARQVNGLMTPKDVFLGISTSGNSPNILKALEACSKRGIVSILLTGESGGLARSLATHSIRVPARDTRLIQESHAMIYHTLCQLIETDLIEAGFCTYR